MSTKRLSAGRIAIVVAIAILVAVSVGLFLHFFERYSEQQDRGWSADARRNPYLAAEKFLAALERGSRRADNIAVLSRLDSNQALYLASSNQIYSQQRLEEFLAWVEGGGYAIVVANDNLDNPTDWLLQHLQIEVVEGSYSIGSDNPLSALLGDSVEGMADIEDIENKTVSEILREYNQRLREQKSDSNKPEEAADASESADLAITDKLPRNPQVDPSQLLLLNGDSGEFYELYFDPRRLLWHPEFASDSETDNETNNEANTSSDSTTEKNTSGLRGFTQQSEEVGVPLMQLDHGLGSITLIADASLWQSQRIGQFDHAYFLSHWLGERDLVLLTQPRFDSLAVLARRYAMEFFIAGFFALLAWLLHHLRRSGPVAPPPALERRSLREHITACGHYYWHQDKAAQLFKRQREQLLRRLCKGTDSHKVHNSALCQRLSASTGLSETEIANTLWGALPHNEETVTAHVRNTQKIEAAL